jgi:hypothetical protein
MTALLDELCRLPGVEERPSQFHGEPALWIGGREFLHLHGDDTVEIRLTRPLIARLDEPRAPARARSSDWVIVEARHRELVIDLARRALEANRR